jgi:hypothetical protein
MSRWILIGCAAAVCALAVAGCGSSHDAKADDVAFARALKFSNCMRAHGVSNFPDPSAGGAIALAPGLNAQSPSFQSAQKACSKYQPGGGGPIKMSASQRREALRFAECMRANGEPDFPDPTLGNATPSGSSPVIALRGMVFKLPPGLNPMSPGFQRAATACGIRPPPGKPSNAG